MPTTDNATMDAHVSADLLKATGKALLTFEHTNIYN